MALYLKFEMKIFNCYLYPFIKYIQFIDLRFSQLLIFGINYKHVKYFHLFGLIPYIVLIIYIYT